MAETERRRAPGGYVRLGLRGGVSCRMVNWREDAAKAALQAGVSPWQKNLTEALVRARAAEQALEEAVAADRVANEPQERQRVEAALTKVLEAMKALDAECRKIVEASKTDQKL